MSDVIFCKTRWQDQGYDPYNDFFRLVELSGYRTIYVDEIDPHSDNTYIVTPLNGEWMAGWPNPKARIIHYELEWRTDWRAEADAPPGVAEVWTMDAHYARQIGAKYVPVGSHPGLMLQHVDDAGYDLYDVVMLAYMVPRRGRIAHDLAQLGVKLAPNGWGVGRDRALRHSTAMLHVHQHDHIRGVACLRWAIAAAYRLPVITENLWDGGIFKDRCHMLVAEYWALPQRVKQALAQPKALEEIGGCLHRLLCEERTFRVNVERAL